MPQATQMIQRLLACQLAALLMWALEGLLRARALPHASTTLLGLSVVLLAACATLGGLVVVLLLTFGHTLQKRWRLPSWLPIYVAGAVAGWLLGSYIASGAWASRQSWAPAAPWLVSAATIGGLVVLGWTEQRVIRHRSRRGVRAGAILGWTGFGALLLLLDATALTALYPVAHEALMVGGWLALTRAVVWAMPSGPLRAGRAVGLWLVCGLLACAVPLAANYRGNNEELLTWSAHPGFSGRLRVRAKELVFAIRSAKQSRGDYVASLAQLVVNHADREALAPESTRGQWAAAMESTGRTRPETPGKNIVLITVDALRADVARESDAGLQRLARSGIVFDRAFSPASNTKRSLSIMFRGAYDSERAERSLVGALKQAGYTTTAVLGYDVRSWLHHGLQIWLRDFSIQRSVGAPMATEGSKPDSPAAGPVTDAALDTLRALDGQAPYFLWVHYYDVHEWYVAETDSSDQARREAYRLAWQRVDTEIERLLDALDTPQMRQSTVVALTSDHGEALGEYGTWKHSRYVDVPFTHVPLIIRAPGMEPGHRSVVCSLVDLAPTLATRAGVLLAQPRAVDGRDLLAPDVDRSVPIAAADWWEIALMQEDRMLLVNPKVGSMRLGTIAEPAGNAENLLDREPDRAKRMLRLLLGSPLSRVGSTDLN